MDTVQIVMKPIDEDIVVSERPTLAAAATLLERKPRPQKEQSLNCPRCDSTNTKFCYYNNYSLTRPRYFCKTCKKYWTEGGTLRNIPVGAGSRKNKRSSSSSNNNNSSTTNITATSCSSPPPPPTPPNKNLPHLISIQNPKVHEPNHHHQGLNMTSNRNIMPEELLLVQQMKTMTASPSISSITATTTATAAAASTSHLSALELLRGITTTTVQDFIKPNLGFPLDGMIGGNLRASSNVQENSSGRLLFPFEDLEQVASTNSTTIMDHNNNNDKEQQNGDSNGGYWNGMIGEGGSW